MIKVNNSFSHDWHGGANQECYDYELEDSDMPEVLEQLFQEWFFEDKTEVFVTIDGVSFEFNANEHLSQLISMVWDNKDALEMLEDEYGYVEWLANQIRLRDASKNN